MRGSRRRILERDVGGLPGGPRILIARNRVARLLHHLPPDRPCATGALDGYGGISRRGAIEDLLLSEHLHDADEFLRRHADREQLYLARGASHPDTSRGRVVWELTPAALGTARLNAIGLLLALAARWAATGRSLPLCVNGTTPRPLANREDVRRLLDVPPRPPGALAPIWPRLPSAPPGEADALETIWVTSRDADAWFPDRVPETGGARALFLVAPHRVSLHLPASRSRRPWRCVGDVSLGGAR